MNLDCLASVELTDVGRKRKNNEDACLRIPNKGVYCVADGMGGVVGGDVASEKVVAMLQETFAKATPEETETFAKSVSLFRKAANAASKWIRTFAEEKAVGHMGSTIVALLFDPANPKRAVGLHAGDSRLYRFRNHQLELLTTDHTAIEVLAKKLGRDPATLPAKYQNELTKAVGLAETVDLEKTLVTAASEDLFLLCCDGLTRMLSDEKIGKILTQGMKLDAMAQALIHEANEAGGKDNITVVLVKAVDLSRFPDVTAYDDLDEPQTMAGAAGSEGDTVTLAKSEAAQAQEGGETLQAETPQTDETPVKERWPPPTVDSVKRKDDTPATEKPSGPPPPAPSRLAMTTGKRPRGTLVVSAAILVIAGAIVWFREPSGVKTPPADLQSTMERQAANTTPAHPTPETNTATPSPPTTGELSIQSTPSGADVFYRGEHVGVTPFEMTNLPQGRVSCTLGTMAATGIVVATITAGQKWETNVVLEARMGKLAIESDPAGAAVLLNGQEVGHTPMSLQSQTGLAQVTLKQSGLMDQALTMTVAASGTVRTNVIFPYGSVVIRSEPVVTTVKRNGEIVGQTPLTNSAVAPGQTTWQLTADGWQPTNVTVEVSDHQQAVATVSMKREKAVLQLAGNLPDIKVSVDGAGIAALPTNLTVDAGVDHSVSALFKEQQQAEQVRLKAGETRQLEFKFIEAHKQPVRWTNNLGMAFVKLPSSPFWIATTRVTPEQYQLVMGGLAMDKFNGEDDHQPCAVNISCHDATVFAEKLTAIAKASGALGETFSEYHFALPTPQQWKEAADNADALAINLKSFRQYKEWCLSLSNSGESWFYGGWCEQNDTLTLTYKEIQPPPRPDQPRALAIRLVLVP